MNGQRLITAILLVSLTMAFSLPLAQGNDASQLVLRAAEESVAHKVRGPAPVLVEREAAPAPAGLAPGVQGGVREDSDATARRRVDQALLTLPLRFIPAPVPPFGASTDAPNAGQTDPAVRFSVKGAGHSIFFTEDEVVFSAVVSEPRPPGHATRRWPDPGPDSHAPATRSSTVRLRFLDANPHPTIEGLSPLRGVVNYFLGNDPARWRANVPTYGAVVYRDLYPGIDLVYRGTQGHLKSEFRVTPGADPTAIQMAYSGVEGMCLRDDGALVLETQLGELIETAPLIYQEVDGVRRIIPGGYVVGQDDALPEARTLSYWIGTYDPARPLLIDPELTYSSYLGGSGVDHGFDIAVDDAGNIYVTGMTFVNGPSNDFPIHNAIQPTASGIEEVFVTQIISTSGVYTYGYSTFLGGVGPDYGIGIAVDSVGNAYVTGFTQSSDFPTHNAMQPTYEGGGRDAFVTKIISASGVYTLAYSTYLGGSSDDAAWDVAVPVDGVGHATVTGETYSDDFPTHNAIQPTLKGGLDPFVTQIISAGGVYTYAYSTYLGGSSGEQCFAIAMDSDGNAYITGNTGSSDFPSRHAIQTTLEGGIDAFVTQIISTGGVYTYGYSSYLGGDSWEDSYGIAVDDTGNIYVTGETASSDFPTHHAVQPTYAGGNYDAFVTQIISAGGVYTYGYSTYLGGSGSDGDWTDLAIAVDGVGNAYVVGTTTSSDFPTRHAIQANQGGVDAFVTRIACVDGFCIYGYSTYLGGGSHDSGWGIAVDGAGNVYVVGETWSSDFPATPNAIQPSRKGNDDAFVTRISPTGLALDKAVAPAVVGPGHPVTYTLAYNNTSPLTATGVLITDVVPITLTDVSFISSGARITPTGSISYTWLVADLPPGAGGDIVITGVVSPAVGSSGVFTLTNQATITTTDAAYPDPAFDNTAVAHNVVDAEPPIVPALLSPANGTIVSDTTPTLTWQASPSPDVAGYWLDWNGTVADVGPVTQYTVTVATDGAYTWTVAAYDALGNTSAYTDTWSFTVDATPPDLPALLSPANGAVLSDTTPTLTWQASSSPDLAGYLLDWNGTVADVGPVTQYTVTVATDGTYTWTVAAYDALYTSPYTDTWSFTMDTTVPDPPTLLSPADNAALSDTTPTLAWQASSSPDVVGYLLDWNGTVTDVGNVTRYTVTVAVDGTYTWTVAAYDTLYTSPYTDTWSLTVDATPPDLPALLSPANGAVLSDTTPTLTWQASSSPDVAGYLLDWDGTVADVGPVTQYTVTVAADGTYTWTVAAYDALDNTSAYTDTWSFTVEATAPAVVATAPGGGAVGVGLAATVIITFSKPIAAGTFAYTVVPDPGGWSVSWGNGGTVATLTHAPFVYWVTYAVTVAAATDLVGNPLAGAPYAWHFTTVPYRLYLPLALRE